MSHLPKTFEIKYKSSISGEKSIRLLNNNLMVNNPNPELIAVNEIKEEKWMEFWNNAERIGLWDLEEEYNGCTLEGGFVWSIKIEHENRTIQTYGANIEPKIVIGDKIYSILEELFKSIDELIQD